MTTTDLLDRASIMRRGDGSRIVEWDSYRRAAVEHWGAIKAAIEAHFAEYGCPAERVAAPEATDGDRLVVYPFVDPHIDLRVAELREGMRQLVARSPATSEAIVTNLGDFWHARDGQWTAALGKVGLATLRALVDAALAKHARVKVRSVPGNHEPTSAFWLPVVMRTIYANEPRVTVEDGFNPYQYDVFGQNLIGWCHGAGAKLEALGEIMATDEPEKWDAASHRFWHTGHAGRARQGAPKELRGCVVDTHRTLAGRDGCRPGRSGRALRAVTYRLHGLDSVVVGRHP